MTTQDLFNRLSEANFTFTKACFESEKAFLQEQKKSMDKLIVCGLVEKIGAKYSLTIDGKKANIIGVEKWTKSLYDLDRRVLVFDYFGLFNNWYNLPRLKIIIERSIKSKISTGIWVVISGILIVLVLYCIKKIFKIEL